MVASNISPPAFFRVIEEFSPTLLIDEADTILHGNDELRGILNSGYTKKTAFVLRVASNHKRSPHPDSAPSPSTRKSALSRFSCWCPKAIAAIGRLPDTLADRCIVISMQRKTGAEQCDRLKLLDGADLRHRCARFIADNAAAIASATPSIPPDLNDRASDIWEPLFALADLAGGHWPKTARVAAIRLTIRAQETSPITSLLIDVFFCFTYFKTEKILSRYLVNTLNQLRDRPWISLIKGKPVNEIWLAQQLRPYGIRPTTLWIENKAGKGYVRGGFIEVMRRYVPMPHLKQCFPGCPELFGDPSKSNPESVPVVPASEGSTT
jgi:hypothetical protein